MDFAQCTNKFFWYRRRIFEGTKGSLEYEFTKKRIVLAEDGLPAREVWLIIKKTIGPKPSYRFFISNAPLDSRLTLFVWLSGVRWSVAQCFEEGKRELGMDHYEVRKYAGWNRHMLITMLSHFFLWHLKIRSGVRNASGYPLCAD